jgi:hypothetical protein
MRHGWSSVAQEIENGSDYRSDYDPQHLEPVKEGNANDFRVAKIVKRGPT